MRIPRINFLSVVFIFWISGYALCAQEADTYVIVHGSWGGSWAFKEVDAMLSERGHVVYRPSLTGQGERVHLASTEVDLNTHILDVVNTILYEELEQVILVGHSYGGMVITGVADSIPERISRLVYLDAFVPNDGESVMTARGGGELGPERESTDGFVIPRWVKATDPIPKDLPQSLKTFTTPVSYMNPAALKLPATYILTVEKGKQPHEDDFAFFAHRATERGWEVLTMVSDHNPQWSHVLELVDLLHEQAPTH